MDVGPKPNIMRRPKFQLRTFDKVLRDAGLVRHSYLGFTLRIFGSMEGFEPVLCRGVEVFKIAIDLRGKSDS